MPQARKTTASKRKKAGQKKPAQPRKQSKPTTRGTFRFRSKFEAGIATSLKKRGQPFTYEGLTLLYRIESSYCPDFILENGIIVEAKGVFDAADRRKMLAVRDQHPDLDIRLCFQNARVKLSKAKRSLTYGQWADRHDFIWTEGFIPSTWFK